jgi:hypothetical protein
VGGRQRADSAQYGRGCLTNLLTIVVYWFSRVSGRPLKGRTGKEGKHDGANGTMPPLWHDLMACRR